MASPRENAIALYMDGIRDGRPREAVAAYTGDRYTQHSTGVADGQEGFIAFFEPFIDRNPVRDIRIVRALQDGQHVFLQAHQVLNHGEAEWLTADFFDSDRDGKIIEHWDVIAPVKPADASGRTQFDGPTEPADLDKTDDNRALVRDYIEHGLIRRNMEATRRCISPDAYVSHNPNIEDGLDALVRFYGAEECPLSYQECFLMVAEGTFVASLNRARWGAQDLCQVDLFRVEDGLIVEHWDNTEPVPPREEWANSGKF